MKTLVYASLFALAAACAGSPERLGEASGGATSAQEQPQRDRWDSRPGSREAEEAS